jgi:hypothetical protein
MIEVQSSLLMAQQYTRNSPTIIRKKLQNCIYIQPLYVWFHFHFRLSITKSQCRRKVMHLKVLFFEEMILFLYHEKFALADPKFCRPPAPPPPPHVPPLLSHSPLYIYYREKIPQMRNLTRLVPCCCRLRTSFVLTFLSFHFFRPVWCSSTVSD